MKRTILGGILGFTLGIFCFILLTAVILSLDYDHFVFSEDWWIFIVPVVIPTIVGAYCAFDYLDHASFGEYILYALKMILCAVVCSILGVLVAFIVGLVLELIAEPLKLFFILPILALIGAPTGFVIIIFFEN